LLSTPDDIDDEDIEKDELDNDSITKTASVSILINQKSQSTIHFMETGIYSKNIFYLLAPVTLWSS